MLNDTLNQEHPSPGVQPMDCDSHEPGFIQRTFNTVFSAGKGTKRKRDDSLSSDSDEELIPSSHKKRRLVIADRTKKRVQTQSSTFTNIFQNGFSFISYFLHRKNELQDFYNRIKAIEQLEKMPEGLDKFLDLNELKFISHLINTKQGLHAKLEQMSPRGAQRIVKSDGLALNLQLIRTLAGKYKLFLEPTRKNKSGNKTDESKKAVTLGEGTEKLVLRSYRLDKITPYACSKIKGDIDNFLEEMKIVDMLDHPHIIKYEKGKIYFTEDARKLKVYSKMACGDLRDVIDGKIAATDEEKAILMLQILDAMTYCHRKGIIHQDFKPENILVFRKKLSNKLFIKVIDFGIAHSKDSQKYSAATYNYESPEILSYHSTKQGTEYYNYFFNHSEITLGKEYFKLYPLVNINNAGDPSSTNDCWAVGVLCYELMYGQYPTMESLKSKAENAELHPVIAKLLDPSRDTRITSEEAFSMQQQYINGLNTSTSKLKAPAS